MENNIGGAKALIIPYQALFGAEHLCVFPHISIQHVYERIVARTQFDEKIDFALLLEKRWIFLNDDFPVHAYSTSNRQTQKI